MSILICLEFLKEGHLLLKYQKCKLWQGKLSSD